MEYNKHVLLFSLWVQTGIANQSINVYSFHQPHLIFQEKKAFTVATLFKKTKKNNCSFGDDLSDNIIKNTSHQSVIMWTHNWNII